MTALSDTWYMLVRLLRATWRQPVWVVVELVQPFMWLVLYGQLFGRVTEIPGFGARSYIQFLTPGVAVMTSLFGSAWAGIGLIEDLDRGVLDRLLTTPASRAAIVLARVLHSGTAGAVQTAIIVLVGTAMGARIAAGAAGAALLLAVAVLLGGGFAAASNGLALLVRREETFIAVLNFVTLPLTFLSASLMSTALMPAWMRAASRLNPVNWAVEAARAAFSPPAAWGAAVGDVALLAAFLAAASAFATWAFAAYRRSA
ncbi:MAG: ABC transporter permease [Firmicutes bacterium]|nr:ABC transporter permease [Bacillota bacterium]